MGAEVRIVGAGAAGSGHAPAASFPELLQAAARGACDDAGVAPRTGVDAFFACAEDGDVGVGAAGPFLVEALGAARRPFTLVAGEGLVGVAQAWALLRAGGARTALVAAGRRSSDVATPLRRDLFALDPVWQRPLGGDPRWVEALDLQAWLHRTGARPADLDAVVARARAAALRDSRAAVLAPADLAALAAAPPVCDPLRAHDLAPPGDGAVALLLARDDALLGPAWARGVRLAGVGWAQGEAALEARAWGEAPEAARAARDALAMAGRAPAEVALAEVDDRTSHRVPLHLEAAGLAAPRDALAAAVGEADGLAVNPSGGALGGGDIGEGNGLARAFACVQQLRGEAGARQRPGARVALALGARPLPAASAAAVVLEAP